MGFQLAIDGDIATPLCRNGDVTFRNNAPSTATFIGTDHRNVTVDRMQTDCRRQRCQRTAFVEGDVALAGFRWTVFIDCLESDVACCGNDIAINVYVAIVRLYGNNTALDLVAVEGDVT